LRFAAFRSQDLMIRVLENYYLDAFRGAIQRKSNQIRTNFVIKLKQIMELFRSTANEANTANCAIIEDAVRTIENSTEFL
jgi:hypothetical protein